MQIQGSHNMKVSLLSFYTKDYKRLADINIINRNEYCDKNKYNHLIKMGPYKNLQYYAYDRLEYLYDHMISSEKSDLYWVLNIQSIITNMNIKLESIIDDEHDCWIAKDVHGLNCGSMLFRNTEFSRNWIQHLIGLEPRYRNASWHEQQAFMDNWLHENWTWKIHLLPQRAINSYLYQLYPPWPPETPGNWRHGDLVLSIPGTDLEKRIQMATSAEILSQIIH